MSADIKTKFAMQLIKTPGDPHKAAFAVIDDPSEAMIAAKHWPQDVFVIAEIDRLRTEGYGIDNPDKETQAYHIYQLTTLENVSVEDKLKAHRLYAEIKGHIERPTVNNGIINNTNKVMVVPMFAHNPDQWEESAENSQRLLQGDGFKTLEGSL